MLKSSPEIFYHKFIIHPYKITEQGCFNGWYAPIKDLDGKILSGNWKEKTPDAPFDPVYKKYAVQRAKEYIDAGLFDKKVLDKTVEIIQFP